MTSSEIRRKFLDFFKERGHTVVPSSSLIPDDPSVLFTTAGMQQFKKYFTGELNPLEDFKSKNVVSVQKCFRTSDIDEVGDESHLTFFEMLGNFSFGGYFKEEAIKYAHEFITKELKLPIDFVSVFAGDAEVPADIESEKIWKSLGVKNIKKAGREDNFWGPTGSEGPCGPTTEIYVKNADGKAVEIWNIVFNEFYRDKNNKLTPLKIPGVDTGMGLERLAMMVQKKKTIFGTDLFTKPFGVNLVTPSGTREETPRIIADHIRGSVFLIADGVRPSNKDSGYILRRLIRRAIIQLGVGMYGLSKDVAVSTASRLMSNVIDFYGEFYLELPLQRNEILQVLFEECKKFNDTLTNGLREFYKQYPELRAQILKPGQPYVVHQPKTIPGDVAFNFHQTYGLTLDIIKDLARGGNHKVDEQGFNNAFKQHQEISRAGAEKKFGGHGLVLDTGELKAGSEEELKKVTRLHTATHLLHQALRWVLGTEVAQRGSDITTERTRFDFTFSRKMTPEEIKKTEGIVNEKIKEDLPVQFTEMPKTEAEKTGALHFFKAKYPDTVRVYYVGESLENAWSKEFCGGPHVARTGEIGKFKITKEEASSAGVRRIRAIVE
jgi:alanyl-tRNA synthetase